MYLPIRKPVEPPTKISDIQCRLAPRRETDTKVATLYAVIGTAMW
jgi:hypothetical protein